MKHVLPLKHVKENLKVWNREVYVVMDLNIESIVKEMNKMEEEAVEESEWGGEKWKCINSEFWPPLHHKESLLAQKARTNWIKQGDGNTKFFHNPVKYRQRRNQIEMLKVGERRLSEVGEIKRSVKRRAVCQTYSRWYSF